MILLLPEANRETWRARLASVSVQGSNAVEIPDTRERQPTGTRRTRADTRPGNPNSIRIVDSTGVVICLSIRRHWRRSNGYVRPPDRRLFCNSVQNISKSNHSIFVFVFWWQQNTSNSDGTRRKHAQQTVPRFGQCWRGGAQLSQRKCKSAGLDTIRLGLVAIRRRGVGAFNGRIVFIRIGRRCLLVNHIHMKWTIGFIFGANKCVKYRGRSDLYTAAGSVVDEEAVDRITRRFIAR